MIRHSRKTHYYGMVKQLLKEIREAWPNPWSFTRSELSPERVKALTTPAKKLHDLLEFTFEREYHAKAFKKIVGRRIANFRKLLAQVSNAKSSADVYAVMDKLSTKSKTAWQKFFEYSDTVTDVLRSFEIEPEHQETIGPWNVVFFRTPRGEWQDQNRQTILAALRIFTQKISSAGFQSVVGGTIHAFPTSRLPPGSGSLASGVLASYNPQADLLNIASARKVKSLVLTAIHELGHRYYFRVLGNRGRKAWEQFFGENVGAPNVDKLIADWEAWAKRGGDGEYEDKKYGRFYFQYLPKLRKTDPDQAMWLTMVADKINLREAVTMSGPKKGSLPGLDQLIAKRKEAQVFLYPVTAYSGTSPAELFAETFSYYIGKGPQRIPEIVRVAFQKAVPQLKRGSMAKRVVSRYLVAKRRLTMTPQGW